MRNHTVEIADKHGHAFKIWVSTPTVPGEVLDIFRNGLDMGAFALRPGGAHLVTDSYPTGLWRTLDKGFIAHNNGRAVPARAHDGSGRTTEDVYLEVPHTSSSNVVTIDQWGIKLFHYQDFTGVNEQGEGFIAQPWALGFDAGRFEWIVVD